MLILLRIRAPGVDLFPGFQTFPLIPTFLPLQTFPGWSFSPQEVTVPSFPTPEKFQTEPPIPALEEDSEVFLEGSIQQDSGNPGWGVLVFHVHPAALSWNLSCASHGWRLQHSQNSHSGEIPDFPISLVAQGGAARKFPRFCCRDRKFLWNFSPCEHQNPGIWDRDPAPTVCIFQSIPKIPVGIPSLGTSPSRAASPHSCSHREWESQLWIFGKSLRNGRDPFSMDPIP